MGVARSRTFRSGNSEAIRVPKDVAFGDDVELVLVRSGNEMTVYPAATSIPELLARFRAMPTPREFERRDDEQLPIATGCKPCHSCWTRTSRFICATVTRSSWSVWDSSMAP